MKKATSRDVAFKVVIYYFSNVLTVTALSP